MPSSWAISSRANRLASSTMTVRTPLPSIRSRSAAMPNERLQSEGPDFTGYHTGSEFRVPPAHSITREDRIKILVQFDGIRAGLYKHCRSERGQAVSYNYRQVLGVLLSFAVKRSRVFPSLDTIARMAMVSKRTVSHAIAWLGLYGFLDKLRRIVRTSGLLGRRVRQTSNAYVLCFAKGLGGLAGRRLQDFT
jgi:Helix-turn-helix domain